MKNKLMNVWLVLALFFASVGAAAQTGTVPLDSGTPPAGLTNSNITVLNGNVGIGATVVPQGLLELQGKDANTTPSLLFTQTNTSQYGFGFLDNANTGSLQINRWTGGSLGINFLTMTSAGNVGIGTSSPSVPLEISTTASGNPPVLKVVRTGGNLGGEGPAVEFDDYTDSVPQGHIYTSLTYIDGNNANGKLILGSHGGQKYNDELTLDAGNVGIGTPNPHRKLHISGDVQIDGNLYFGSDPQAQGSAYAGVKCGGDYAESVDVTGDRRKYEPGDVLVIDPSNAGKFLKSAEPYSTSVMGIYSTKPGVLGRRQTTEKSPDEIPMAMVGIVPTKVSAENGPIRPGDLLVSSSTPGYAMKGTDRGRMLGAIVGKALGSLAAGTGVIEVGVTLQ